MYVATCKNDSTVALNRRPTNCSKYLLNVSVSFIISWFLLLKTSITGNNGHHKSKINTFWIQPFLKATRLSSWKEVDFVYNPLPSHLNFFTSLFSLFSCFYQGNLFNIRVSIYPTVVTLKILKLFFPSSPGQASTLPIITFSPDLIIFVSSNKFIMVSLMYE